MGKCWFLAFVLNSLTGPSSPFELVDVPSKQMRRRRPQAPGRTQAATCMLNGEQGWGPGRRWSCQSSFLLHPGLLGSGWGGGGERRCSLTFLSLHDPKLSHRTSSSLCYLGKRSDVLAAAMTQCRNDKILSILLGTRGREESDHFS